MLKSANEDNSLSDLNGSNSEEDNEQEDSEEEIIMIKTSAVKSKYNHVFGNIEYSYRNGNLIETYENLFRTTYPLSLKVLPSLLIHVHVSLPMAQGDHQLLVFISNTCIRYVLTVNTF